MSITVHVHGLSFVTVHVAECHAWFMSWYTAPGEQLH